MQLTYVNPAAKETFIEWYNRGEHKDIKGNKINPEDHPDIEAIVKYFNNEIVFSPIVGVIND